MKTDRQTSPAAVVNQPAAQHCCYVASAGVADVLFDQLEYLVAQRGRDCPSDCVECSRLERVKHWLLFRSVITKQLKVFGGRALPLPTAP